VGGYHREKKNHSVYKARKVTENIKYIEGWKKTSSFTQVKVFNHTGTPT
jgi:hypothetical protein